MGTADLPARIVAENCREGRHARTQSRTTTSYDSGAQGYETCLDCGSKRSWSSGKSYEPPYWVTGHGEWEGGRYFERS